VFSTGVLLAMESAVLGADAVEACLRRPAQAARALARFDREVRRAPRRFSWFIYRVTSPAMRSLLMSPQDSLRLKEALLALLAGHPIARPLERAALLAFRVLYYAKSLADLPAALRAWRRRRASLRDTDAARAGA
jgi:hypothetical protein